MSEKIKVIMNNSLLSIIAGLLSIIIYFGYHAVEKIDKAVDMFNAMNNKNIEDHYVLKQQVNDIATWTNYVYENEIKENTERSTKNEKELNRVKTKVGLF